jgi:ribonuclease HIII
MNNENSAKKQIQHLLEVLQSEGIKVSSPEKGEYSFQADLSAGGEKVKLLVYFGAKGVKTVLQGNKTSDLYKKSEELLFGEKLFQPEDVEITEPDEYIGTDESGKGDYFGPLVIAGMLVNRKLSLELKKIGVKDSKLLTESTINGLAEEIKLKAENNCSIVFISPARYNALYEKFGNLNRLLAWGHARVIENLLEKHDAAAAISDKFGDESLIKNSLLEKGKKINLYQYHRAERYTAVAAASILARYELNKWFVHNGKKLEMKLPKGASDQVDKAAAMFVKKYGSSMLSEIAKIHFKTTKKFLE